MNILFIAPLPPPITGQSLASEEIYHELNKVGYDVQVVNLAKSTFKQGISSIRRVWEIVKTFRLIWSKQRTADLIYFTVSESVPGNIKDLLIYAICFRKLPVMLIHLHGGAGMRNLLSSSNKFLRFLNKFFLKRTGAIIILGKRHAEMYQRLGLQSKLRIVPNFAEDYLFVDAQVIDSKYKQLDPIRILFLSNLLPGKGYLELVAAFKELGPELQKRAVIDFAGGFESAKQQIEFESAIADFPQIVHHGTVQGEKKLQLLSDAHAFCLPTYYPYEGQPISILEAYAAGCVVITTDHSGIYDIFSDGRNGLGVEKKSVISLKQALEAVILGRIDLNAVAHYNSQLAREQYTARNYNANLLAIINSIKLR